MARHHLKHEYYKSLFLAILLWLSPVRTLAITNLAPSDQTSANTVANSTTTTNYQLTKQAEEAAKLLGIENDVNSLIELKNSGTAERLDKNALKLQLSVLRKVMNAGLELRTTSAKIDKEIVVEQQALDKLSRERDFVVALTNNANFYQLDILSMVIDGPGEETRNADRVLNANRLNIVSGFLVGGLALLALAEQRGGMRSSTAEPNMLGQPLGLNPSSDEKLPPMLWTYLNSVSPTSQHGLTRREQLIEYWKTAKVLTIDIKKPANVEKVSALGARHNRWCESIKLIRARISMLYDLRAIVDLLNSGLVDLLKAIN